MCGRFFVAVDDPELRALLRELEAENKGKNAGLPPVKTGEVFPTDYAAVVTALPSQPRVVQMRWGFTKFDGKGVLINARSETVLEKPTFRGPAAHSRCLIPASYYLEWMGVPGQKKKIRHIMRDTQSTTMYLAGVFRQEAGEPTPRFVILTKEATGQIQRIHHRMPVILDQRGQRAWLSPEGDVNEAIRRSINHIEGLADPDTP